MPKYKSLVVVEDAQGFEPEPLPVLDVESDIETDEAFLPQSLASMLYGGSMRVDHLLGDGLWAHAAVGA